MKHSQSLLYTCLLLCVSLYAEAQISAEPTTGCAPLIGVTFSSNTSATNITWNFGDGTTANIPNPVHTFIEAGTYNVSYSATLGGASVSDNITINVYNKPAPNFSTSDPLVGCVGLTVNFSDLSVGGGSAAITDWTWDFGDGGVSNTASPSHTYTLPGNFDVSLNVQDSNGCDSILVLPNYVNVTLPPSGDVVTTPPVTTACSPPFAVSFSGALISSNYSPDPSLTYAWDFGEGTTSNIATPPVVTYLNNGTYDASLTVNDANGCEQIWTQAVIINEPIASFEALGAVNDTVCTEVTFVNNSSPGSYLWVYGDGSSGLDNIHVYEEPGNYEVTLYVSTGLCTNDTTINIVVQEVIADFVSDPSYSCEIPYVIQYTDQSVNAASWYWQFGHDSINFVTSTEQHPINVVYPLDTNQFTIWEEMVFSDTLTVTSQYGCTDTYIYEYNDTLYPLTAHIVPNATEGCAPYTVTFADSSHSNEPIVWWAWDFGDGSTSIGTDTLVTHEFTDPGKYEVILTVENVSGCVDTSYVVEINVGAAPSPNFSVSPTQVCPLEPVQFTNLTNPADSADMWHYDTDADLIWHCPFDPNPTWGFWGATGPQDVTLTASYNQCEGTYTIPDAVTVLGPIARFEHNCICAEPYEINFEGNFMEATSWDWDFGDGTVLLNTTEANPTHNYTESGDYWATLTSYNANTGCPPFQDSVLLKIRQITASFGIADTFVCVGDTLVFDASASTDVAAACGHGYQWYFDDGHHPINTDQPIYEYAFETNGAHDVRLVTEDVNGCTDTVFMRMYSYVVQPNFTAIPDGACLPLEVAFTDQSIADTTMVAWQWDFGDGNTSTEQHPTHVYTNPPPISTGVYTIELIVQDALGCANIYTATVEPSIPTSAFTSTGDLTLCEGEATSFAPEVVGMGYDWDFGDGNTSSTPFPTHVYETAGMYNVALTVTDMAGCTSSSVINNLVSVQGYPQAAFTSSADTLVNRCYPLLVEFTDTSLVDPFGNRTWDLDSGSPVLSNSTVGTLYDAPGTYDISLIVATTYGCQDTITKSLTIEGPLANISIDDDLICKGEDITFNIVDSTDVWQYSWDFGDGFDTTNVAAITHTYNINPVSGQTMASLVYWSPDSACSATTTVPIFIHDVIADFDRNNELIPADTIHCLGETDVLTNNSVNADTWNWDLGDGTTFVGENPPAHVYEMPGEYDISLNIADANSGCVDEIVKTIVVKPLPVVTALGDDVCLGDSLQLSASGGVNYVWTPSLGLSNATAPNPTALLDSSQVYHVLVIDEFGCTGDTSVLAQVYLPPPAVVWDTIVVIGEEIPLITDMGEAYTYIWTPATGLSCADCPNPIAMPLDDTDYTVQIADSLGCFDVTSYYNFVVKPVTSVDVPTAFTPNNDGVNDIIYADGWGIKNLLEFNIFNRYGELVFSTTDIETGWDGYFNNKPQNMDSYSYIVTVETWLPDVVLTKTGTFNLIR